MGVNLAMVVTWLAYIEMAGSYIGSSFSNNNKRKRN